MLSEILAPLFGSQTIVLRKFVREEDLLTLENAVRKMTSLEKTPIFASKRHRSRV
jgi:N-acyl-D-aspartate/D-glutamate deacylase